MEPFFSIITVCLNAGENLQKTINSVLLQNFNDFNIIVKDGYSNDGSYEILQDNDKILKIQKKDNSIYDAMNQALEFATGKYVIFLNAGDFFYDNSVLSSFYENIIKNNFPGLVFCDYKITRLNEKVISPNKLSDFFLFRRMLCHQVCMIKREYYNCLGNFDTNLKVVADYDFLLRLIIKNKVNYKHIKKIGIISTSYGFSYRNKEIVKEEVIAIRRKYYPKIYPFFKLLLLLTFPEFRTKIANNSGMLGEFYQKVVNVFNRIS